MSIYPNRVLDLKKTQAIGFDMDHTLVRYHIEEFEKTTYEKTIEKLIKVKNYPASLKQLKFDSQVAIRGLVLDRRKGNLVKLSRFNQIKMASHGTTPLSFEQIQEQYQSRYLDLNEPHYYWIDTAFSISHCVLFAQLVTLKDQQDNLPSYEVIADDVLEMIDLNHRDNTLKNIVRQNVEKYILKDQSIVHALEKFKQYGKKLLLITNSDYAYTKLLMDYAFNPFLKNHQQWQELFEIVVTSATKPRFFSDNLNFLKIDPDTGLMSNVFELESGIYQGGSSKRLQEYLQLKDREILYIGDHIYGDILRLKKNCNWRTALVVEEIRSEKLALDANKSVIQELQTGLQAKVKLEQELNKLQAETIENQKPFDETRQKKIKQDIQKIDQQLGEKIQAYNKLFTPYWGEVMRAGREESCFANQIERYACIYMASVGDFLDYSPQHYFRPAKRLMAHDLS